jgi:hypothetical protein
MAAVVAFFVVLQIASAVWVGFDASGRDFSGSKIARSPAAWVVGCLILWIVCFPLYLAARSSKPRNGSAPPHPPAPASEWSHPQFSAPTAAPERMSVPPPPKR